MHPISSSRDNPRRFHFRGRDVLLVSIGEHYGSVINGSFDFRSYLNTLHQHRLNYTRIYTGAYFEPPDFWTVDDVLAPLPSDLVVPWRRSKSGKFDLEDWNQKYFDRLAEFAAYASELGIVVEVCFFNCTYPEIWPMLPMHHNNNIQGVGICEPQDFPTRSDGRLFVHQERYVRKIVEHLREFDNVIYEIVDEPTLFGANEDRVYSWISDMIDVVNQANSGGPSKLITQQVLGRVGGILDLSSDNRIGIVTGQFVHRDLGNQIGGILLLDSAMDRNKPIEINETGYFPIWIEGDDKVAAARVLAWEFMLGGGAAINFTSSEYTCKNPTASGTVTASVMEMLCLLLQFLESHAVVYMEPYFPVSRAPDGAFMRGVKDNSGKFVVYVHHSRITKGRDYIPSFDNYRTSITFCVDPGNYWIEWIDPRDNHVLSRETKESAGMLLEIESPSYVVDIAVVVSLKNLSTNTTRTTDIKGLGH